MAIPVTGHFEWSLVDGIVLIEVTTRELSLPKTAQRWAEQLRKLQAECHSNRYILDLRNTEFMSSTAFAVVVIFNKEIVLEGGRLAVCELKREVRRSAEILSLGRIVPLFDDLESATASFL